MITTSMVVILLMFKSEDRSNSQLEFQLDNNSVLGNIFCLLN